MRLHGLALAVVVLKRPGVVCLCPSAKSSGVGPGARRVRVSTQSRAQRRVTLGRYLHNSRASQVPTQHESHPVVRHTVLASSSPAIAEEDHVRMSYLHLLLWHRSRTCFSTLPMAHQFVCEIPGLGGCRSIPRGPSSVVSKCSRLRRSEA